MYGMGQDMSTHEKRVSILDEGWKKQMPCYGCGIFDVCKYANSIKRPDFNGEVFDVSVTCKIRCKYDLSDKQTSKNEPKTFAELQARTLRER